MLNLTCKPSSIGKRLPHSNPILSSQHLPQHQQPSTSNNGYSTGSCHLAEYVPPSSLMNEQLSGSINQLRPRANLPTSQTRAINNMLYHPTTPLHPKKINGSNNNTNNIGFNNTRYLTEGSRGAIKDKSGHGYPVIKLCGYMRQPIKIQCFIGHDKHIGTPHLFYQASRIAGKNSTNCQLKKVDGTSIILMEATPSNNMEINVDCIGILKERNVDVEQKLNKFQSRIVTGGTSSSSTSNNNDDVQQSVNNIKRSTRCRLVFRCEIPETGEILQAVSVPILCTQPLGTPEINKKSTDQCDINGGVELFIIGKNFLKDAKVIFRNEKWIKIVEPNREYLKSTHLICMIPPFDGMVHSSKDNRRLSKSRTNKSCASNHLSSSSSSSCSQRPMKAYELSLMVKSGGKCSEPHRFFYTVNGQLDTNDVVATTDSGEVLTLSSYDTESTNNTMMDSLIDDNSCSMKESSPYINHQGQQQQQQQQQQFQLETNQAISHSVDVNESSIASTSNSPIGIGSNAEMTPQLGQDVLSPIGGSTLIQTTGPEQILDQQSNSATVQVNESPSVLQSCMAAAAVVAANEVQALSNSNQLTAANLHQTVTTAAAVAVAATEAVLADNSPSSNCGLDSQQASQTIPNPPNQSAVALVAAQINSMIPYLTISDTASALAAAAAIKQEPEPSTVPSQTVTQPGSTYMTMPSHDTNTFQPNLIITPSSNSQSTIATSPKQQQQQLQSMMIEPNETMKTETNHIGLMNQFGTTDADVNQRVHTTITSTNVSIGNMSMETNPISFAALNHQATTQTSIVVDPMATLKVDTLTLNDKVQLPQLTLSDINNQLSIPSVVATTSAQMNMIPIETVMNNEKPVMFSSEIVSTNNHINLVKTVTLSDGSMVSMTTAEPTKQEPSSASSASVIMGPSSGYQANLVNHHMQLSSTASDYSGLISSDLIISFYILAKP
ncbi:hypothetical protein RDWZM_009730 [Blomia tropicalis]|uniref:RHD domain-containing protein n=1 Tax=Blomia tropicalis TaxID=40697 RepID=A0A9Q0RJZ3_BLOTA|nr:hypothetical protein RDWZM_009730 [Blomia tropicalis]